MTATVPVAIMVSVAPVAETEVERETRWSVVRSVGRLVIRRRVVPLRIVVGLVVLPIVDLSRAAPNVAMPISGPAPPAVVVARPIVIMGFCDRGCYSRSCNNRKYASELSHGEFLLLVPPTTT